MTPDILETRQIRIFISSTFKDMQEERGYLVTKVFPELRRYCEKRDVSIFELDLRWGISEEEAKQGKVFEICLNEVQKTRPFFIGLLGERYGWVPSEEERKAIKENTMVFDDYPWIPEALDKGTSITEIEIQEGVLRAPKEINAYFYLRSPKIETPDDFKEKTGSHAEEMLLALKKTLREQKEHPVNEYDSIEHLGTLVESDFKRLVDKLFPEAELSLFDRERREQRNFLKRRTRVFVPNPALNALVDEFTKGEEKAIAICGGDGTGKSAFLANWITERQRQNNENEKIIYHFIGESQSEGDYRKITKRLIDEVRDIYNIPAVKRGEKTSIQEMEEETDELEEEFQDLLFSLPKSEKLIIVLEGVDRLLDMENAKLLNWIPPFPENVKFIFSTVPDDTSAEALELLEYRLLSIEPPEFGSRKQLVNDYLKYFSKALLPSQVERIAADKKSENPLVLLAILDELRVVGVHERINEQIESYLAVPDGESIFDRVLERTEKIFYDSGAQKNLVRDFLSLITASGSGLSETELLDLTKAAPLYWSQFSNSMAEHLTTVNGLVTISNRMMRDAVKKRYLSKSETEQRYRRRIADYFEINEQVSFERRCNGLPHQLFELAEWEKLYTFLLDYKAFQYIYEKDEYALGKYWRVLLETDKDRYKMEKYLELDNTVEDKDILTLLYDDLISFINEYLGDYSLALKFALKGLEICEKTYRKFDERTATFINKTGMCYDGLADYQKALEYFNKSLAMNKKLLGKSNPYTATSYNNIGLCYSRLSEYQKALKYNNKSLAINKKILEENHPLTATSYNNIGLCHYYLGDYQKALEYYKKSLAINEKVQGKNNPATATTYNNMGLCYSSLGNYQESLEYHNKALAINENVLGKNHPSTALSYNNSGLCHFYLGDNQKALEYFNKSLVINEELQGKDHPVTALSYNNIGMCYSNLGDYQKALEYFNKALTINENVLSKNHPDTGNFYNNIGLCHYYLGDNQKALEYFNKASTINENTLGKNHPSTALSYNNIGRCYSDFGEYKKALEYCNKSLAIREKVLGKNHNDTAESYNSIGLCHSGLGEYKKALEHFNKSIAIREKVPGKHQLDTAESYNNIGMCYSNLGVNQKALDYYSKSLEIREEILGKNHPDTAESYNNIGMCYSGFGEYQKALEYLNGSLEINEEVLGENHPLTASSYDNIGKCHYYLGDYQQAIEYYNKSLAIREEVLGENHPDTAESYNNIGMCYSSFSDYQKALEYLNRALAVNKKLLGKDHPGTAISYNNVGLCHFNLGEYKKALEYYKKSLAISKESMEKDHPNTALFYNNIGLCYSCLGEYQKALEYLNGSLAIYENAFGENHPGIALPYNNIGFCYSNLGEYQKALEYYNKCLKIRNKVFEKGHPDNAATYYNLGICYSELGNNKKALKYYQRALSIYSLMEGQESKIDEIQQSIEELKEN